MSNPVFMGHAHKLYGWNECYTALNYLFIPIYLYLWLLKKLPRCLKELLIGEKLQEIMLAQGVSVSEKYKYTCCKWLWDKTTMGSEQQCSALDFWGSTIFFSSAKRFSLVSSPYAPLWPFGIVWNSNKANYKGRRKTEGQHNRGAVRHPLLQLHTAEKSDPQQQQASVRSNPSCTGYGTMARACKKSVLMLRDTQ